MEKRWEPTTWIMSPEVMYCLALRTLAKNFSRGRFDSKGSGGHLAGHTHRAVLAGLLEQGDEAINFANRVFIGLRRAGGLVEHGVDQDGDGLGHAIEDKQLVGDEEIDHRGLQVVVRRDAAPPARRHG